MTQSKDTTLTRITDLGVQFGDAPVLEEGDVPLFWACGVTPQAVVLDAKPELAIFHKPGHMIITAQRDAVV